MCIKVFKDLPWRLMVTTLLLCIVVCGPGGYHLAVVNMSQLVMEQFVNKSLSRQQGYPAYEFQVDALWSLTVSCQGIGSIIGSFAAAFLADKLGRRNTVMIVGSLFYFAGSGLLIMAKYVDSFELIAGARLLIGVAHGLAVTVLSVYLTEASVPHYRGLVASLVMRGFSFGSAAAQMFGIFFSNARDWNILFGLTVVPSVLCFALSLFIPDTPKYLLLKKKDRKAALRAVRFFYGKKMNTEELLDEIVRGDEETELRSRITLSQIFQSAIYYQPILLGVAANLLVLCGTSFAIWAYSTSQLLSLGISEDEEDKEYEEKRAYYWTIAIFIGDAITGFLAAFVVHRLNRRPLLLGTAAVIVVCQIIISFLPSTGLRNEHLGQFTAFLMLVIVCVSNLGIGTISLFIAAELSMQTVRATAAAVATTVRMASYVIVQFIFPLIFRQLSVVAYLPFAIAGTLLIIWLAWRLPETRNRMIDEIILPWRDGVDKTSTDSSLECIRKAAVIV